LVNFDPAFGAEEMALEFDVRAAGAMPFSGWVDIDAGVPLNFEQVIAGWFVLFVDALKLERIEPNSAATPFADIDRDAADLFLNQFIIASGASHERSYHSAESVPCQVQDGLRNERCHEIALRRQKKRNS
jgi:hypothetical protein